jgi:hypothetical protein
MLPLPVVAISGSKFLLSRPQVARFLAKPEMVAPFRHYYAGPTAQNVFDADYIKLREITLGFNLPSQFISKLHLKGATISGFARNLATWGLDNKNFDPEMATTGSGNIQGFEGGNLPASKTFGFNLKLQF